MTVNTPNGFTLDTSGTRVVVDVYSQEYVKRAD